MQGEKIKYGKLKSSLETQKRAWIPVKASESNNREMGRDNIHRDICTKYSRINVNNHHIWKVQ